MEALILSRDNINNLKKFLSLDGYQKTKGMIYLKILDLPSLDGLIITKWNEKVREILINYLETKNLTKVVIRTDALYETGGAPRGGYIVDIQNVFEEIKKYLVNGRIVILLEPRNRFDNLYGINALFDSERFPNEIYLEVVGPGFDVSDINRGDVTPHERITLARPHYLNSSRENFIIKREIIEKDEYRKTIRTRLIKIGKMVCNLQKPKVNYDEETLIKIAKDYLLSSNNDLLLKYEDKYPPIPIDYLKEVYDKIMFLPERLLEIDVSLIEPFVVSMSIFNRTKEVIFWDIQWIRFKYNIFKMMR